jgi:hypothetical protein
MAQDVELQRLRTQVIELYNNNQRALADSELRSNNRLARYQGALLIKILSYEIRDNLKKQGYKRSLPMIESHVKAAFDNSWVFTDLGDNHIDRIVQILQWGMDESGFNNKLISSWKAGTYLPSIKKTVMKDTMDYYSWQINEDNLNNVKLLNYLYESGIINFKIKKIRTIEDLMDIPTNCAARCMIETDRKARGWEWRHAGRGTKFSTFLRGVISKLEKERLYNKNFVEKYYNLAPIKTYNP